MSEVKRWCGRAAAGTESAAMYPMVEWYADGGDDQQTPYILASDYDVALARIAQLKATLREMLSTCCRDSAVYKARAAIAEGVANQD